MDIIIIAAMGERNRVIGRNNNLPWSCHLRPDLKFFMDQTMGSVVIMGRNTWDSLPAKARPLPGRQTIVVSSRSSESFPGALRVSSIHQALVLARESGVAEAFIAGGAQLYLDALPLADRILLTLVDEDPEGDVYFPEISEMAGFVETSREILPDFVPRLTFTEHRRV